MSLFPSSYLSYLLRRHLNPWQDSGPRARRVDIVGSLLFAGALCSGIMAISFGGALYPWTYRGSIGLFCCSGALWIAFSVQQATSTFTTKEDRILPIHVLRSKEMWNLIFQTGCPIRILYIAIYYIPLYSQFVRGESAIRYAVDLPSFLSTSIFAMLVSGRLIREFGWYKLWFTTGSGLAFIMSTCLYKTDIDTSHGKI